MTLVWDGSAWDDYLWWQTQDRKGLKRINTLIKDVDRNSNEGIGKPEPLNAVAWRWPRTEKDSGSRSAPNVSPRSGRPRPGSA